MAEQMDKKVRMRTGHRKFLSQLMLTYENAKNEKLKLKTLQSQLEDRQRKLDKLDEDILDLVGEHGSAEECITEVNEAGQFKVKTQETLVKVEQSLQELELLAHPLNRADSQEGLSSTASLQTKRVRARLPKLELKKFSGKPYDWQEFWDAFRSSIDENEELAEVDKFKYLRHLLEDPAKGVVAGFSLTKANYVAAVNLLKQRYAKPSIIRQAHINELRSLKPVCDERDITRLQGFYNRAETHFRGLVSLDVDETNYSLIIVPELMDKLPQSLRISMIRASDCHGEWNLSDFLTALKKELEICESHAPLFRTNFAPGQGGKDQVSMARPNNKQSNGQQKTASALHSNVKERRCAFCLGKYEEIACGAVKNKEERKNIVRKFGRCYVCLKKGHQSFESRGGGFSAKFRLGVSRPQFQKGTVG